MDVKWLDTTKEAKTGEDLRLNDDKKPRRLRRKAKKVNKPEAEDEWNQDGV